MKNCDCESSILKAPSRYNSSYVYLASNRVIFLKEDIDKENAAELSALLLYYDSVSNDDIILYIHSNGGDSDGLVNIYDVMRIIQSPVRTVCLGKAYSAAAVLLAAGTRGKRYAHKHSKIMIHGVQFIFPMLGDDQINSKNYYEFVNKNNDNIMKMLAEDTGHTLEKIKEDCKRDLYLDAKQAVEYGIIDHII